MTLFCCRSRDSIRKEKCLQVKEKHISDIQYTGYVQCSLYCMLYNRVFHKYMREKFFLKNEMHSRLFYSF